MIKEKKPFRLDDHEDFKFWLQISYWAIVIGLLVAIVWILIWIFTGNMPKSNPLALPWLPLPAIARIWDALFPVALTSIAAGLLWLVSKCSFLQAIIGLFEDNESYPIPIFTVIIGGGIGGFCMLVALFVIIINYGLLVALVILGLYMLSFIPLFILDLIVVLLIKLNNFIFNNN